MTVYAVEIDGKSVAAFNATTMHEAEDFAAGEEFATDLAVLEHNGKTALEWIERVSCPRGIPGRKRKKESIAGSRPKSWRT